MNEQEYAGFWVRLGATRPCGDGRYPSSTANTLPAGSESGRTRRDLTRHCLLLLLVTILAGCESDFDKCFKANQAKLNSNVSDDRVDADEFLDLMEIAESKLSQKELDRIERATHKESEALAAATDDFFLRAGCEWLDENNNLIEYDEGTECFDLDSIQTERLRAFVAAKAPLILEALTQINAVEICNAQGIYE